MTSNNTLSFQTACRPGVAIRGSLPKSLLETIWNRLLVIGQSLSSQPVTIRKEQSAPGISPGIRDPGAKTIFLISALLFGLVLWTFLPSLQNNFVNYDDPDYVTANPV